MVGVSEYYTTVDGDSRSEPLRITAAKMIELNPFLFHINFRNADSYRSQSRTQSNACARARMALALGKLNFSCAVIGLTCMPTKSEPLNLGVPGVNFPRANAILARAQALLWVRDWFNKGSASHTVNNQ
jgi:hypothetical protein